MVGIMRSPCPRPTGCEGPIERFTHLLCHSIARLKTALTNTQTNTEADIDTETAADTDTGAGEDTDTDTDTALRLAEMKCYQ